MNFRQSLISAHHNYLINQMLTPGFLFGEPDAEDDFWLLADVVLPGEKAPYLSGRFYDQEGDFLLHLRGNQVVENPGNCVFHSSGEGFRLLYPSGEVLLALQTEIFANGYLTRIQGKLYDKAGALRMEPSIENAKVFGMAQWALDAPLRFQEKGGKEKSGRKKTCPGR
jgi:hypothetical protein